MGGEGTPWIGIYLSPKKRVLNLRWTVNTRNFAIRAALDAKVNITYKILYNDVVAMEWSEIGSNWDVDETAKCLAEGVKVSVLSQNPKKYNHQKQKV